MRVLLAVLCMIPALSAGMARAADPARIYAAGSLSGVLPAMIIASGLPAEDFAPVVFGPAGALGQRILKGESVDLFASADLTQPQHVVAVKGGLVVPFARNRMCVLAPDSLHLTRDTLLDRLLSPRLRLATSTPAVDPGGDYAMALFAKAEALRPGAKATLSGKALMLLVGANAVTPQAGHSVSATVFLGNHADAILSYCSSATATAKELPNLAVTQVPHGLEVNPVYGFAVLSQRPDVMRLALFILSERGQRMLAEAGLLPLIDAP
jgi:molybdate transport system substrate-binding protein